MTFALQKRCSTTELQGQTPPARFELATWKLTVSRATAAPQGITKEGATPLFRLATNF